MTKEGDPKWVRCAEDMFQEMKDKNIPISQITYHVLMNIYSKSKDPDGARKAEELLRSMTKEDFSLNDFSYNICIDGYARRGDHRRAESLLEEMISLTESGNLTCQPTIHSFASVVRDFFLLTVFVRPSDDLFLLTSYTLLIDSTGKCVSKIWRCGCSASCKSNNTESGRTRVCYSKLNLVQ